MIEVSSHLGDQAYGERLSGRLVHLATGKDICCTPTAVTTRSLEITSLAQLPPGEEFFLFLAEDQIRLELISAARDPEDPEGYRYLLQAIDYDVDLRSALLRLGYIEVGPELDLLSPTRRGILPRAARHSTQQVLYVELARRQDEYTRRFHVVNFSESGLLLSTHEVCQMLPGAVLSASIDPDARWLADPIECLARVVRAASAIDYSGSQRQDFGVTIVQMDHSGLRQWQKFIAARKSRC